MTTKEAYWNERSKVFENLNWVRNIHYLKATIDKVAPRKTDVILDVGTGTGIVASELAPFVDQVIGIDISQKMIENAISLKNIFYIKWNICDPLFQNGIFDKVVARQVLHHLPKTRTFQAVKNCFDVLKEGGRFVVAGPICPSDTIRETYNTILKLKDGRQIFTPNDLITLLKIAGFISISSSSTIIKNFSIKNWLDNNALAPGIQDRIFEMHVTASSEFRQAFNMKIVNGDCLIDIKMIIIKGEKRRK